MFTPTSNMSNVWRGITENSQWIKKGSATAIGNGNQTLFWDHNWALDKPLRSLAILPIPVSIEGALVSEMWEQGGDWKWDVFPNILPADVLKKIAAHKVVTDPDAGDLHY